MESISKFKLHPQKEAGDINQSKLFFLDKPVCCEVAGSYLEAQYQCSLGFLLMTTEDVLYEEALHITLLSVDLKVLDTVELSHSYAPGLVRDLHIINRNTLDFTFFGNDCWRLTVFDSPKRWPAKQLIAGIADCWKRLLNKGYLGLQRLD